MKLAPQAIFLVNSGRMAKPSRYTTTPWHTRMRPSYHFSAPSRIFPGIKINSA